MNLIFGDPTPVPTPFAQLARIVFHASLQIKWSHCSSSADFLSQYFASVLRKDRTPHQINEATHSIAYLANELIENAVKFRAPGDIEIEAGINGNLFLMRIANWISQGTSRHFQLLLREITDGDPGQLLIQRIEANAADRTSSASGLGLLTLMNDYGVKLTWNFQPTQDNSERIYLETVARLHLPDQTS